jgi:hypothetical protein
MLWIFSTLTPVDSMLALQALQRRYFASVPQIMMIWISREVLL